MPKVICTLPNASASINGVKFMPHERGVISDAISDTQAEAFLSIPGYEPEEEPATVVVAPKPAAVAPKATKKAREPAAPAETPAAAQDDPNVF